MTATSTATLTPSPLPPRQLTLCLPEEPASLFLYGDSSRAARSVRAALNDGPIDWVANEPAGVLVQKIPSLANGGLTLQPVQVYPNDLIVDGTSNLTNLAEGVSYFPSGCATQECAQVYAGQEPISMDQLVVRYRLRPDLRWSDGAPLTAADSQYSYEVARAFGGRARSELLARTQSYQALDETTIEWRAVPGYRAFDIHENFFSPLPRQAWSELALEQLLSEPVATRTPPGWGPYTITEWVPGERISLVKNAHYYRVAEGLPRFDTLSIRFLPDAADALAALRVGTCDLLDPAYGFSPSDPRVESLLQSGAGRAAEIPGTAWEHLDFGITPAKVDPQRPPFFQSREVRQAVAQCIDRAGLAAEFAPPGTVLDSFVPADQPGYNPAVRKYAFDPGAANDLLQASGWIDSDNNPATPRVALGVAGIPDGTPFSVTLFTSDEPARQRLAQAIGSSLGGCGIQVEIAAGPAEQVFAPGPDSLVFGRQFDLAQFAWPRSSAPACLLYLSTEIPGPYQQHPKGWGGANPSGYSNPLYDQACQAALNSLPGTPEGQAALQQAQLIFAEDLPALPLFQQSSWLITRSDFCGLEGVAANRDVYWNLESFDVGAGCL